MRLLFPSREGNRQLRRLKSTVMRPPHGLSVLRQKLLHGHQLHPRHSQLAFDQEAEQGTVGMAPELGAEKVVHRQALSLTV